MVGVYLRSRRDRGPLCPAVFSLVKQVGYRNYSRRRTVGVSNVDIDSGSSLERFDLLFRTGHYYRCPPGCNQPPLAVIGVALCSPVEAQARELANSAEPVPRLVIGVNGISVGGIVNLRHPVQVVVLKTDGHALPIGLCQHISAGVVRVVPGSLVRV